MENKKYTRKLIYLTGISFILFALNKGVQQVDASTTYNVQAGDTLFSISQQVGKTPIELAEINDLTSTEIIQSGDTIIVEHSSNSDYQTVSTEFIDEIGSLAREIADKNGLYASVMIAQAILESNYGQSALARSPHHNLFGIKGSYQGSSVNLATSEYINGQWLIEHEPFRSYPSYEHSLNNNAQVLRFGNSWSANYYRGAWKENTNHYKDATKWLENRYATDPNYSSKLNNIIERYSLTNFDKTISENVVETSSKSSSSMEETTHIVKEGDTVFNIAKRYGLSIKSLKESNHLSSDNIRIGQKLKLAVVDDSTSDVHIVKVGDTLFNIAKRYGITVEQLKNVNQKSTNHIIIGERLSIDGVNTNEHIVRVGDTLFNIAKRYDKTVDELKTLNGITSNKIKIGQTLKY